MTEYITKKDKQEDKPQYITRKEKKKIDLGEIVSKALNKKEDKPQYITKKQKSFITKKSPEEIRERGMTEKASGGRIGLRGGGICKRGMNRKAIGKNS
jgi:hypothetical protein